MPLQPSSEFATNAKLSLLIIAAFVVWGGLVHVVAWALMSLPYWLSSL